LTIAMPRKIINEIVHRIDSRLAYQAKRCLI
jgi:hypothetical protein